MKTLVVGLLGLCLLSACNVRLVADTVLVNGKIFTANPSQPWVQALAIRGDRVIAAGDLAAVTALVGPATRTIDVGGRTVVPGFNDAHAHISIAPPSDRLALPFDPSIDQIAGALRAQIAATPAGKIIQGDFGERAWASPQFTRAWLDTIAPDHPVWLGAFTGHGQLLNSKALAYAGIDEGSPEPDGGSFARDAQGRLNGRLEEYGGYLAYHRFAAKATRDDAIGIYRRFADEAKRYGVTSVQLMGVAQAAADASDALVGADLPMRWKYFRFPIGVGTTTIDSRPPMPPQPSARIDMRGMKWILDGTPFERLAYLRQPYADAPGDRGRLNLPADRIDQFVGWAYGTEDPLAVHAVGDAAIEAYLSAAERIGTAEIWQAKRPRLEHGDLLAPDLLARVKALHMVVVQNPPHFMFPEVMLARFGKERVAWMQPMKTLLDQGIPLAIGSDGPTNPFPNIAAAVTHPTNPREALTREQAVSAYTAGSAFAEFEEKEKGQLAIGMFADIAILSDDLFTVPVADIATIRSVMTIFGGKVIYDAGVIR